MEKTVKQKTKKPEKGELSEKEQKILRLVVEEYIESATPVGSNLLCANEEVTCSSATVRNIMARLEKKGFLLKNHTSSGRVPSTQGFKYYEEHLTKTTISKMIRQQLEDVFNHRNNNIDEVLNSAVQIISSSIKLPAVITTVQNSLIMRKIELIQLNENTALLLIVFNEGTIQKNEIDFKDPSLINDTSVCIDILNERLSGLTLQQISEQIEDTAKIIKAKVNNYEFVMQQIVTKIFNQNWQKPTKNVINSPDVLEQKEFQNIEKVKMLISLLDNTTIWEQIAFQAKSKQTPKITFGSELNQTSYKDIVIATTNINVNKTTQKQISVLGPTRMKYGEVIALLEFIKEEIENNK